MLFALIWGRSDPSDDSLSRPRVDHVSLRSHSRSYWSSRLHTTTHLLLLILLQGYLVAHLLGKVVLWLGLIKEIWTAARFCRHHASTSLISWHHILVGILLVHLVQFSLFKVSNFERIKSFFIIDGQILSDLLKVSFSRVSLRNLAFRLSSFPIGRSMDWLLCQIQIVLIFSRFALFLAISAWFCPLVTLIQRLIALVVWRPFRVWNFLTHRTTRSMRSSNNFGVINLLRRSSFLLVDERVVN